MWRWMSRACRRRYRRSCPRRRTRSGGMTGRRSGARRGRWTGASIRAPVSRVVAVFGGGGAKTLAHAGAWKALLEAGLQPPHIVGTSTGAAMGAALAAGSSYDRLVGIALSLHRSDFAALDAWALA